MPRSLWLLTGAASTMALSLVLTSCAAPAAGSGPGEQTRSDIYVTVTGCGTQSIFTKVSPWVATVRRGQPVRWHPPEAGIDSMVVQAKNPNLWPFPWATPSQAQRRPTLPGRALQAGSPGGPDGASYEYSILVYCGDHVIDIDPEIIVIW